MVSRRSHGTGSLVERPAGSGKWMFRYAAGVDPTTGKWRRRTATITAKNKSAAQAQARKILAEVSDPAARPSATLDQLLSEWMTFQKSRGRSPTTLRGYQSVIDNHIKGSLGGVKLLNLSAHQLDSLYAKCSRAGKSPRTIRNIHNVISAALNQAIRWGWLEKNPALRATLPVARPLKIHSPSPEEARELISACHAKDELLGAFVFIAAVTGCRRGEVAALRWRALQNDLLVIDQSAYAVKDEVGTKSTKSGRERVVHLDQTVQDWFAYWRSRCELAANEWGVELNSDSFVLSPLPDGSEFVNLDSMSREVRKVASRLGMKSIHLHSLRHFAATELLAAGISPRDAAEMLGHADPSLTLRVYAHASTERQKIAAGILAGVLDAPRQGIIG
jgi:integrase